MNNHAIEYDDRYHPMYPELTADEYRRELAVETAYGEGGHDAVLGLRAAWALAAALRGLGDDLFPRT